METILEAMQQAYDHAKHAYNEASEVSYVLDNLETQHRGTLENSAFLFSNILAIRNININTMTYATRTMSEIEYLKSQLEQ